MSKTHSGIAVIFVARTCVFRLVVFKQDFSPKMIVFTGGASWCRLFFDPLGPTIGTDLDKKI